MREVRARQRSLTFAFFDHPSGRCRYASRYPATDSILEWANEIMAFDQLLAFSGAFLRGRR